MVKMNRLTCNTDYPIIISADEALILSWVYRETDILNIGKVQAGPQDHGNPALACTTAANLCAVTVTASVAVTLGVDVCVLGNVDNLGLDLGGNGCGSDGSSVDLVLALLGSRSRGGLGLGAGRLGVVVLSRSLTTAHVELHVLALVAGLGLDIIGKDVRALGAGNSVVAGEDGAPGVSGRGSHLALLVTRDQVVTLLLGRAVVSKAVHVGDVKVVEVKVRSLPALKVVLELNDVVALALLGLGDLDGDTDISLVAGVEILAVNIPLFQGDHVAILGRASVALEDRPKVDIVFAAVDDLSVRLLGIAVRIQLSGVGSDRRCGSDQGRGGDEGNEHVG